MKNKPGRKPYLPYPTKITTVMLSPDQIARLDVLARDRQTTRSALVRDALDLFLATQRHFVSSHSSPAKEEVPA